MNEVGVLLLNLLHYCKRKVKEKVCVSTKQNWLHHKPFNLAQSVYLVLILFVRWMVVKLDCAQYLSDGPRVSPDSKTQARHRGDKAQPDYFRADYEWNIQGGTNDSMIRLILI